MHQGTATQQLTAALRPAHSKPAGMASAPLAAAASAAALSQKKGLLTSGLVASRVLSAEVKPSRQTNRLKERVFSAPEEAMDTSSSRTVQQVPKEWWEALDHSKKEKDRILQGPKRIL